ncbi:MAG: cytochrome c [Proteobacteria bacterium]|nr:cytochrome c [Pseudomonadota bacterium]
MNATLGMAALLLTGACTSALADETTLRLKDGAEAVTVRAYCSICHSIDYVQMNAPFMKRAQWDAEVHKMVKVMGAPVPDDEVAKIIDYLTRNYGVE